MVDRTAVPNVFPVPFILQSVIVKGVLPRAVCKQCSYALLLRASCARCKMTLVIADATCHVNDEAGRIVRGGYHNVDGIVVCEDREVIIYGNGTEPKGTRINEQQAIRVS